MDKNNVKSDLEALFKDVQSTLDNSILKEKPDDKPKKAAVGVKEIKEVPRAKTIGTDENSDFGAIFDGIKDDIKKGGGTKKPAAAEEKPEEIPAVQAEEPVQPFKLNENQGQKNIDEQLLNALGGDFEEDEEEKPEIFKKPAKEKNLGQPAPVKKFNILFKASPKEYVSREQNDGIYKEYQRIYIGELVRLIICGVLFLILAYLELAPVLNLGLPDALLFYSSVYILINLQIFLFAAFTVKKSLFFGFRSILRSELNLYSAAALFVAFAFIHTVVAYILKYNVALFNSVAALAMLSASLYNIFDISFEIAGFQAVSTKKLRYALQLESNAPAERALFKDVIQHETSVGRISKTAFASNFFSRTGRYKNYGESGLYIYVALTAALIAAVIFIALNREVSQVITAAAFLFLGSVPLCSFISSAYPVRRAQKKSQESGAAFIGANSIEENSEIAILSLADKDIFPPSAVKLSPGVKVYGNNRLEYVLQYLCALFVKLDLPSAEEFKKTIVDWDGDKKAAAKVRVRDINETGICFETDGLTLFTGKPEYIENLGLRAPVDPDFDEQFLKSSGSMMLLASEAEVLAKIYLKYELTSNYHGIIKNIKRMNSCVCIKTLDPNIDDELLYKLSNIKNSPIKILKLQNEKEVYKIEEKIETGIVSKESLKSIIYTLLIANRTKRSVKTNALIQNIAFFFNLILAAVLIFFGSTALISAGILLAIQLFWGFTILFLSSLSP